MPTTEIISGHKALLKHLAANRIYYLMTGSTAWFGKGNDIDYLVRLDTVPPELLDGAWVPRLMSKTVEGYEDDDAPESYNVRDGDYNYLIKDMPDYLHWVRATKMMKRLIAASDSVAANAQSDREYRVALFKLLRKPHPAHEKSFRDNP